MEGLKKTTTKRSSYKEFEYSGHNFMVQTLNDYYFQC